MAKLTVTAITKAGVSSVIAGLAAASLGGDSIDAASGVMLVFENTSGSARTVTVAAPVSSANCGSLGALPVADIVLALSNLDLAFLAIPAGYIDGSGDHSWTYDDELGLSVGAFSIAP